MLNREGFGSNRSLVLRDHLRITEEKLMKIGKQNLTGTKR